ncbi:hypothetical protein STEG23_012504 [Scotinomys teguina]
MEPPRLGPEAERNDAQWPPDPPVEAGKRSSPAGMREGVSSATPRPATQESRASTGSSRLGLAPPPPIRPWAREPEACGGDVSRDAETPESAGPVPDPGRQRRASCAGRVECADAEAGGEDRTD